MNKLRILQLGKIIFFLLLYVLISFVAMTSIWSINICTPCLLIISGVFDFLLVLFLILFFSKILDKESIQSCFIFTFKGNGKDFFIGGLLAIICVVLGFLVIIKLNWQQIEIEHPLRVTYLIASFIMMLFRAFSEEIIFRRYVLTKLTNVFLIYISVLISSLLFTVIHLFNSNLSSLTIVNIFIASLLLSLFYLKTNNIWLVTGFHFCWNYVQALLGFNVSGEGMPSVFSLNFGENNNFNGGTSGFEGSYVCSIIMIMFTTFLIVHNKKTIT